MENKNINPLYKEALAIAYLLLHYSAIAGAATAAPPGQWKLLLNNTGVVAMHMALTHYNTVLMFDQTSSGPSNYRLPRRYNGRRCQRALVDLADPSCYAHSVEYSVSNNKIRPLFIEPDPWASSGSFLSNGTLLEAGGFGTGSKRVRYFRPCKNSLCDWSQGRKHLTSKRWYASSLRLPDHNDRVIVVGGSNVSSYEFVPKASLNEKSFNLPFLKRTYDAEGGNNLYPILHLSPDGHIFIFANTDSILFNYKRNKVVKTFPRIPGKGSRTYPSSASSVLLPLDHADHFLKAEVMICGGAAAGAVPAARRGRFLPGLSSCGRMTITGNNHKWKMEQMPGARLMHNMIILPNGNVLIINGAGSGCAGKNSAARPALQPYLYKPKKQLGRRFSLLKPSKIARMYHSSAILLPDGKILVAGGNPNNRYVFKNVAHPTELRLQAFTPGNMEAAFDDRRPSNVSVEHDGGVAYGGEFSVRFMMRKRAWHSARDVVFTAYASPFNTHSISMDQRLLVLRCKNVTVAVGGAGKQLLNAVVEAPPSAKVAPAGYYMMSVVYNGVPSVSQWVRFMHN
ncbi:aldehyde oxidase GLOX-like [Salvia miltiorrhiza]|uniref:aldehyde oxidase GLOX-like n=1 Tax=Salvia miltiorrhiza TaxID=226208 RepID=UPI0025AD2BD5|nr:aldehyde oxidase GLOX-like [Salvia miltiorrhiza]